MGNLENDLIAFHVTENNRLTHPFYKANGSVTEINARLLAAHRRLAYQCHHAQCVERTPSERTCCINLLLLISEKTFREACQILSHDELDPQSSYKEWYRVIHKAERRWTHQLPIITHCEQVRNKSRPPKPEKDNSDKEKAEKPDKEKSAGDKDKPASEKEKAPLKKHEYEAQLKTLTDLFSALSPPDKRKTVTHGKHSYYALTMLCLLRIQTVSRCVTSYVLTNAVLIVVIVINTFLVILLATVPMLVGTQHGFHQMSLHLFCRFRLQGQLIVSPLSSVNLFNMVEPLQK